MSWIMTALSLLDTGLNPQKLTIYSVCPTDLSLSPQIHPILNNCQWNHSPKFLSFFFNCSAYAQSWTVAHQAPLSMGFSRQEYWSGWSFPSPGNFPNPEIEPRSPTLQEILYHSATWEAPTYATSFLISLFMYILHFFWLKKKCSYYVSILSFFHYP